jgi:hypothetical protein
MEHKQETNFSSSQSQEQISTEAKLISNYYTRTSEGEALSVEELNFLGKVIGEQGLETGKRKEALLAIKYVVPKCVSKAVEVARESPELMCLAQSVLSEVKKYHQTLPTDALQGLENSISHRGVMVAKQTQVAKQTTQSTHTFESTLNKSAHVQQSTTVESQQKKVRNFLGSTPPDSSHIHWYYTHLAQVTYLYKLAHDEKILLTKKDLEYLGKQCTSSDSEIKLMVILAIKSALHNGQKLTESATAAPVKILKSEMHGKPMLDIKSNQYTPYTRTLLEIPEHTLATLAMIVNSEGKLQDGTITTIRQVFNKEPALPSCVKTSCLAAIAKSGKKLLFEEITFLQRALDYIRKDSKPYITLKKPSSEGSYQGWLRDTSQQLGYLVEQVIDGKRLPIKDLQYLVTCWNDSGPGRAWISFFRIIPSPVLPAKVMKELAILGLKWAVRNNNQALPDKAREALEDALVNSDNQEVKEDALQALIALTRGGQSLSNKTIDALNNALSQQRKDAAMALGYYVAKYGIVNIDKSALESLLLDKDPEVRTAASFAINKIMEKNPKLVIELNPKLEKQLLDSDNLEIIRTFLNAVKQQQSLTKQALENFSKILVSPNKYKEEALRYAAVVLGCAAGNHEQPKFTEATFNHLVAVFGALTDSSNPRDVKVSKHEVLFAFFRSLLDSPKTQVSNNVLSALGFYAIKDVRAVVNNDKLIDSLGKALNQEAMSENASFLFSNILKALYNLKAAEQQAYREKVNLLFDQISGLLGQSSNINFK